jgi:hypothetical protein
MGRQPPHVALDRIAEKGAILTWIKVDHDLRFIRIDKYTYYGVIMMFKVARSAMSIAAMVLTAATVANADSISSAKIGPQPTQLAALAPPAGEAPNSISLPPVVVHPNDGEASIWRSGPRTGWTPRVAAPHFRVWAGYDLAVALHPYTSGIGPCPEGSNGAGSGCSPGHGEVIRPSHYERGPFTD